MFPAQRGIRWAVTALAASLILIAGVSAATRPATPAPRSSLETAAALQRYTWTHLAAPYPIRDCEAAYHVAYARELGAPIADHWYVSSQLMADVALARADRHWAAELRCPILKSAAYLEKLWNPRPPGGYFPRSDLDGSNPTTRDIYADDNAIAGLALLEAYEWLDAAPERERLLRAAQRAADYLIESGLWDDEYGGGFWWNTQRHESDGGKPVQTAGLAIQLFVRLHAITGEATYRTWAIESLRWSNERLFDPGVGLYQFGFRPEAGQPHPPPLYVSYDQAIMIGAHLAVMESIDPDPAHLERARLLAAGLARFRSPLGGYAFELDVPQVLTAYSAWTSAGLLELYRVDRDRRWLELAEDSIEDLASGVLDGADGGAFYGLYACTAEWASVCPPGASWSYDNRKLHLSQSWMQRTAAMLSLARLPE